MTVSEKNEILSEISIILDSYIAQQTVNKSNYKVTVQCFGVTGSQSGTSYYAGSMNYSIEFFET